MLYLNFIHPYVMYVIAVFTTIYLIRAIFTKTAFISKYKDRIIKIVAIILIFTQLTRYIGVFFDGGLEWNIWIFNFAIPPFNIRSYLPFYMCRISGVVLLYYVLTRDKRVESFLFFWGSLGLAGVLYPNGSFSNSVNLTETFYIDHILLTVIPFFLIVYQGYRPSFKHVLQISGLMFVILLLFIPINNLVGADYFYIDNQSIFAVLFGKQPKLIFITVHSLVAMGFFSIYNWYFKDKEFVIEQ